MGTTETIKTEKLKNTKPKNLKKPIKVNLEVGYVTKTMVLATKEEIL